MTNIKPIIIAISMVFALLATAIVPGANANGFQSASTGDQSRTAEPSVAVTIWRDAAMRGDSSAQFMLGLYNAKGQDLPQDLVKPYAWFKISAPNYPLSKVLLKHVEGQLSKDKIALANVLVAAWQRQ